MMAVRRRHAHLTIRRGHTHVGLRHAHVLGRHSHVLGRHAHRVSIWPTRRMDTLGKDSLLGRQDLIVR